MSSKAAVFRAIAEARRSSRRFQPNRAIPEETLRDILETTMVRSIYEENWCLKSVTFGVFLTFAV